MTARTNTPEEMMAEIMMIAAQSLHVRQKPKFVQPWVQLWVKNAHDVPLSMQRTSPHPYEPLGGLIHICTI